MRKKLLSLTEGSLSNPPECSNPLEDQFQHRQIIAMVSWLEQECSTNIVKSRTDNGTGNKRTGVYEVFGWPGLHGAENKIGVIVRPS